MKAGPRPLVQPGEPAPDFTLPAADREGTVALADYRGRTPGIIRWTNIECAREGLAGLGKFPTDEQLLAAVRALAK